MFNLNLFYLTGKIQLICALVFAKKYGKSKKVKAQEKGLVKFMYPHESFMKSVNF